MNKTLWQYYVEKASEITSSALENIKNRTQWEKEKKKIIREFFVSVGLYPFPEKCNPSVKVVGEIKKQGFRVKKIVYQILPECYSSGHLFLPDPLPEKKLPAILYACGHSGLGTFWYQKHGIMWAKRGYACFIFDTIRQSENTGDHHGLYTGNRLDWISRGYASSGGELLNSICALDVLCEMPEIDRERIGATGISGGGAHSHFITIADERIKVCATSCGISVIKSALENRTMFQHCDCMYTYGNFQRDISEFSGLIAPRPILFCFASEDNLFLKEEYMTFYKKVKKIYKLYGYEERCQLFEYPGPHAYSKESVKKINDWFDKYLAEEKHPDIGLEDETIPEPELAIFNGKSPEPNRLNLIPEFLTIQKTRKLPENKKEWETIRTETLKELKKNVFHWLDRCKEKTQIKNIGNWIHENRIFSRYKTLTAGMEGYIECFFPKTQTKATIVAISDYKDDANTLREKFSGAFENCNLVLVEQRACGRNAPNIEQGNFCLYRAGALTGITPVMMWMNDLGYIIDFFMKEPRCKNTKFVLYGSQEAAGAALYYSVFDENIQAVVVENVVDTHAKGCYILGIMKEIDIIEASGLMAPRIFAVVNKKMSDWVLKKHWGIRVYERLGIVDRYIFAYSTHEALEKILSLLK